MVEKMENEYSEMGKEGGEGGYCIKIHVSPEGEMSVSSSRDVPEPEGATPVKSIGEAIKVAMDIYESDGEEGGNDFDEGFGPDQKSPMMVRVREGE